MTTAITVSLVKGQNVNITKDNPGLTEITVGLGWNPRVSAGAQFDLDASAFLLNADGSVRSAGDFVFFNNKVQSPEGAVLHSGDNLTGEGEGDDETMLVDLAKVPSDVERIRFVVNIYDAITRRQNFGQVGGAYIRAMDSSGSELARYDLSEDYSVDTTVEFGELYRNNGEWKFRALGEGKGQLDLTALARTYGVGV